MNVCVLCAVLEHDVVESLMTTSSTPFFFGRKIQKCEGRQAGEREPVRSTRSTIRSQYRPTHSITLWMFN